MVQIAVIGGGAGGLCAAIAAAQAGAQVTVFERAARAGSKILATGNGRCNLTNARLTAQDYNAPTFVESTLEQWNPVQLCTWFENIGLLTVEERQGRIYPLSNSAHSVVDVLLSTCKRLGVQLECGWEATGIEQAEDGVTLTLAASGQSDADDAPAASTLRSVQAYKAIIACGGGSTLLESCGHASVSTQPTLCALATNTDSIRGLSGVRTQVELTLFAAGATADDEPIFQEEGEVLFRDYGISGIVVFNASRFAQPGQQLILNLMPCWELESVEELLEERASWAGSYQELLCGMLHPQLNRAVARAAGCKLSLEPTAEGINALAQTITAFKLTVKEAANIQAAQLTKGGAALDAFDESTLQSKLVPGVYAVGECLDVDAPCGGYNLHWAMSSGIVAGSEAAK